MARDRSISRSGGLFSGVLLISVGILLLLHNYGHLEIGRAFFHWWPLLLILLGAIKLFERTMGRRIGDSGSSRITAGEIFLALAMLALLGLVAAKEWGNHLIGSDLPGDSYNTGLEVPAKTVPLNARIAIRGSRGDISVRTDEAPEIRISGKKSARAWTDSSARSLAEPVSVEIVQNGDGYEIHPTNAKDSRVSVDMDVTVPSKASVSIRSEKGDVSVSGLSTSLLISNGNGDVEARDISGEVGIESGHGDIKVSNTKGNVKVSGRGESVEVIDATGGLTVNGEFVGPIHAERVAKGVRLVSHRTDLTISQLNGHMEAGSGNLEIVDSEGNLMVRTRDENISTENAGGKIKIENRNGTIEIRFSSPPKDDIEIANSSAIIALSVPGSSSFEIVADCHSCDIDSEFDADSLKKTSNNSGDSHLEGKYGSGRGPRITLKTSYGEISLRRTSGDVPAPHRPPSPPRTHNPPELPDSEEH